MSDLPEQLVGGPDDTDDGFAWVEDGDEHLGKSVAVPTPATQLSDPHPGRRYILEEMVSRYNAHENLKEETKRLREALQKIKDLSPVDEIHAIAADALDGEGDAP